MPARTRPIRSRSPQAALFDGAAGQALAVADAAPPTRPGRPAKNPTRIHETADTMAARQREISIAEFFTKNRHLLGFDNAQKALLTAIKEAVDNSLDACEEAGILPDLEVEIHEISENRYRIAVEDNGPGIVRAQVPKIFGKLLYGSKFHRLKQQRGQQGIGISAAGMYGVLTTGKPVRVISRISPRKPAHLFEIAIDTQKNAPVVHKDVEIDWAKDQGTRVEIELEAVYKKGRRSVDDYIEQTAVANPHVRLRYLAPREQARIFGRVTDDLPRPSVEIKPHPIGVELGILIRMLKETEGRTVRAALQTDFSRVSLSVAEEICAIAGVSPDAKPGRLSPGTVESIFHAISKAKIMGPSTTCLSPIGQELLEKGLATRVEAEFVAAVTRPPAVYRGNPFQIEVGLAYGGGLPADELVELFRFANRVPLQYQQSSCAMTKSAIGVDWRNYGLQQSRSALPTGPMVVSIHIASVWVPFTSESKESVASYPEIIKEIRLGLMEAGRRLGVFLRHRRRVADEEKKRSYIEKYIPHIGDALQQILGFSEAKKSRTIADLKTILEKSRKI